jgi:hypothetical protein
MRNAVAVSIIGVGNVLYCAEAVLPRGRNSEERYSFTTSPWPRSQWPCPAGRRLVLLIDVDLAVNSAAADRMVQLE